MNMKNVGLGGNGGNMPGQQVSFQRKNPDFLFNNPDFLLKNVDFLLKILIFKYNRAGC